MFEFLFRYPLSSFSRGQFAFLSPWPVWLLVLLVLAAAGGLGYLMWMRTKEAAAGLRGWRQWTIWALQAAMAALILCLLWQPALVLNALKPQQNVIAVVIDDSRSMSLDDEGGTTRIAKAKAALNAGVLDGLKKRFQTRIYRMGDGLRRVQSIENLNATAGTTHIGEGLSQLADESAGLPVGAIVMLTDGSDNDGGLESSVVSQIRGRRIPVHTVGFGKLQPDKDVEITEVQVPGRALPDSRLAATVSLLPYGVRGQKTSIKVMGDGRLLAAKEVTFGNDGVGQTETVLFNAGAKGARSVEVRVEALPGEKNKANNSISRLVNVEDRVPRILYIEGEPRWDFKFIRRAVEDDKSVALVTMLRTTQNKIYYQGVSSDKELEGFPATVDDLFKYQAIVIGSVELNYFTQAQQELLKQFVDRRGGGLIFLGSRNALSESGWDGSSMAELLPVELPRHKGTFVRAPANVEVTAAGSDSVITRLAEDPAKNIELWKKLPYLMDYQDIGTPKPAATVLANLITGAKVTKPFLVTHNYGRGRVAVIAGSSWRWQMLNTLEDMSHEMFWRQALRWASTDTPGRIQTSSSKTTFSDEGKLKMTVDVRDKNYLPTNDAQVVARIVGPGGTGANIELRPDPALVGQYSGEWTAEKPGQYAAEVTSVRGTDDISRDVLTFQRQDGVAEAFHTQQNKLLLERLSEETGGKYWTPDTLSKLPDEISYSDAGVTVRETRDLWNLPIVFIMLIGMRAAEWLLRRKWGVV